MGNGWAADLQRNFFIDDPNIRNHDSKGQMFPKSLWDD